MININAKAININPLPYNTINDTVYIKVEIRKNLNPSYIKDIHVKLYGNVGPDMSTMLLTSGMTNEFGIIKFEYNTNYLANKDIQTCLMWAEFEYNGVLYRSNRTLVNFIKEDSIILHINIIDANDPITRLNSDDYAIYDANTVDTRTPDDDDYTIIERIH